MKFQKIKLDIPLVIKEVEAALTISVEVGKRVYNQLNNYCGKETPKENILNDGTFSISLGDAYSKSNDYFFDEYVFAGGAISNLYMSQYKNCINTFAQKYPFKDVDIFVDYRYFDLEVFKKYLPEAEIYQPIYYKHDYMNVFDIDDVIQITYKEVKFEIVVLTSMMRVHCFDYRFRNFFYKRGESFATENALQDIENKKLVASSLHTPGTSYVRGLVFEKNLGFEMDKITRDMLIWNMSKRNIGVDHLYEYLDGKELSSESNRLEIKEELDILFEGHIKTNKSGFKTFQNEDLNFPLHENVEKIMSLMEHSYLTEEIYEYMNNYQRAHHLDGVNKVFSNDSFVSKDWNVLANDFYGLFMMDSLSAMLDSNNDNGDYDVFAMNGSQDSVDFDMLEIFFRRLNVVEQIEVLRRWDYEDKYIVNLEKWFASLANNEELNENISNFINNIMLKTIKIDIYSVSENTLHSLLNSALKVNVKTLFDGYDATYEFLKTDRGIFTLADTSSSHQMFYSKKSINYIISVLKNEFPADFDFGIDGETAPRYNLFYSKGSHFFKYKQKENKSHRVLTL